MADAINVGNLPPGMDAYAGYVNGNWPTYPQVVSKFPTALHLSIAVNATADGDCLDIENGDATNAQAGPWVARQRNKGAKRPCVYTSLANAQALIATLDGVGIPRHSYRLWTAHYTNHSHICSPACGLGFTDIADGTQWTDHGGTYDESLLEDTFFDTPTPEAPMLLIANNAGTVVLVAGDKPALALTAAQWAKFQANGAKAVTDDTLFNYYTAQTPPQASTNRSFNITLSGTGTPA